jgi:hypothetical protein
MDIETSFCYLNRHFDSYFGIHMLLLTEAQIEQVIRCRRATLLGGVALVALAIALPRGWGCGLFSGFMLFSLGIYGVAFRKWRTEPGLWMLAILLTATLGPCWAYFEFMHWRGLLSAVLGNQRARQLTWDQLRVSIDCVVALLLIARAIKLAATVAIENWRRTRLAKPTSNESSQLRS